MMRRERDYILRNRKLDREMPTHMHRVRERDPHQKPQHHTHSETHTIHSHHLCQAVHRCAFSSYCMGCTVQVGKCAYLPVNVSLSLPQFLLEIFMHSHNVSFSKLIHPQVGFPSYLLHPVAISFPLIHEILSPSLDISAYTHYSTQRPKISTGTIYLQVLLQMQSKDLWGKLCPELAQREGIHAYITAGKTTLKVLQQFPLTPIYSVGIFFFFFSHTISLQQSKTTFLNWLC